MVSVDTEKGGRDELVRHLGLSIPVVWDEHHRLAEFYRPEGMPATVILDPSGDIVYRHVGSGLREWRALLEFLGDPVPIGGGIGIAAWLLDNTLRKQKHSGDYVRKLHEMLALRTQESMASLREELADVGEYSGLDQLERLRRKFEAFDQLLRRKLDPNELTFGRYLGMAEQLFSFRWPSIAYALDILAWDVFFADLGSTLLTVIELEEPEQLDYPGVKNPAFKEKFGPRGVLHCWAR